MRLFLVCFLVLTAVSAVHAATYYIATTGNNNNNGLSTSAPWATIAKANATLQAGDTVLIRGGEYAGASAMIIPANSGTASQPIIYQAYPSETPVITDTRTHSDTSDNFAIDLTDRAYIVVDGITVDGKQPWLASNVRSWARMSGSGSHHNIIQNCTLKFARGWAGIAIMPDSHYNQVLNCLLDNCGVWDNGSAQDAGDSLLVNGNYNIIDGNVLRHGGHNLMVVEGSFNVIRNNDFDNDWSDIEGAGKGQRSLTLGASTSSSNGYNVFENNVVKNAGASSDSAWNTLMKAENTNQIVRRNYLYNSNQYGIISNVRSVVPYSQHSHIYHNTFYNLGGPMWQGIFLSGGIEMDNQVVKNNIVYKGRQNPQNARHDSDIFINLTLDGKVLGANRIISNSFMKATAGDAEAFVDTLGNQSLTWMESNHPNNFSGNLQVDPDFVSSNPQEPEDFELQTNSPMIDAGAFLTVTAGSGSGTQITLADSRYFSDGFGIVDGDLVQIGSNAPVRITAVNYSSHVITVDQSITWGSGNGVSLPYNGSAPDIGAWESGGGSAPAAPSGLTATAVSSSQINLSWNDNASSETGFEVDRAANSSFSTGLVTDSNVAANSTSYQSTGLTSSSTYYYRVRAANANGDSPNSNSANATTLSGGGGAIAFRSASNATANSYATSLVVPKPAGVVSGDFMLLGLSVETDTQTVTAPSGWTLVREVSDNFRMWVYKKTAGGSEPSSYTWNIGTSSKMAAGIVAFTGVSSSTPIQVENGAGHTSSASTSHTTPTISTSGTSTWLVSVFGDRNATGSTWTAPSGATERVDARATGASSNPSVAIYTQGPVSAGNQSHTATSSVSGSIAGMEIIALQP